MLSWYGRQDILWQLIEGNVIPAQRLNSLLNCPDKV